MAAEVSWHPQQQPHTVQQSGTSARMTNCDTLALRWRPWGRDMSPMVTRTPRGEGSCVSLWPYGHARLPAAPLEEGGNARRGEGEGEGAVRGTDPAALLLLGAGGSRHLLDLGHQVLALAKGLFALALLLGHCAPPGQPHRQWEKGMTDGTCGLTASLIGHVPASSGQQEREGAGRSPGT